MPRQNFGQTTINFRRGFLYSRFTTNNRRNVTNFTKLANECMRLFSRSLHLMCVSNWNISLRYWVILWFYVRCIFYGGICGFVFSAISCAFQLEILEFISLKMPQAMAYKYNYKKPFKWEQGDNSFNFTGTKFNCIRIVSVEWFNKWRTTPAHYHHARANTHTRTPMQLLLDPKNFCAVWNQLIRWCTPV